jgi:hypothetical protein
MRNWVCIWLTCASLAVMPTLTGCSTTRPIWPEFEIPSQPDYLYLPSGATVQTRDGIYRARQNEKWVNPRVVQRYQDALRGVVDAKSEQELKELMQ